MPTKANEFAGEWLELRDMQRRHRLIYVRSKAVSAESRFVRLTFEVRQRANRDLSSNRCSMYSSTSSDSPPEQWNRRFVLRLTHLFRSL